MKIPGNGKRWGIGEHIDIQEIFFILRFRMEIIFSRIYIKQMELIGTFIQKT